MWNFEMLNNVFLTKVDIMLSIIYKGQTRYNYMTTLSKDMTDHTFSKLTFLDHIDEMKMLYKANPDNIVLKSHILKAIVIESKAYFALNEARDALGELSLLLETQK